MRRGINYKVQISFFVGCMVKTSIAFTFKVDVPGDSIVSVGMNTEETSVICKW